LFGYSQTDEFTPYWNFGIKQGINYSSVIFSPGVSQGLTLGYTGGLVYKYQNQRMVGIQMELNYTQKGWTENLDTVDNSYSRKMDYIELPLITHIVFGKKNLKYYVNIGTTFAYLISEKEEFTINNESYRQEYYEKEIEQKFDYSGLGEIGVLFHTKIGEFQTGVRMQWTLINLFKITSETEYYQSQTMVYSFSINYFLFSNK
jgi:hypothetical protein